jgi:uncharacterized membrane protein YbhN (UPF0104 family)
MAKRRRLMLRLLIVAACMAALAWTVASLGPRRVLDAALRADPVWLALSALPIVARFVVWGFKWKRMLARRSPVPYSFCIHTLAAGSFVNLTTPSAKLAGGVVRAAFLHRRFGWRMATAYGWSMADQVTNVLGHLLLYGLLATSTVFILPPGHLRSTTAGTGLLVIVGLALTAGLRGWGWRLVSRPGLEGRLSAMIPSRFRAKDSEGGAGDWLGEIFAPLLHRGGAMVFLGDLALAAFAFSFICASNALALRALGVETPFLLVATVVALGYFAGVVVGAWGGIGVTEAALTGLYMQIGIPGELAAAGALLHRAIFYAVVLSWGGIALLRGSRLVDSSPQGP